MAFGRGRKKNEDNTEIDLVAFISLLSVCICFLLLTTIWIQIGSMNVKQSVGAGVPDAKPQPMLMVNFSEKGEVSLIIENAGRLLTKTQKSSKIEAGSAKALSKALGEFAATAKTKVKQLDTALIQPAKSTEFESIISAMDALREAGLNDLGVSPL